MEHHYSLDERIKKYDKEIDYISGYKNYKSIVNCYCHRCNNFFNRKWYNLARNNTEYCCPICQTQLGKEKSNNNHYVYTKPLNEREQSFVKRLNERYPQYEYISGYTHSEKPVLIKCKLCGDISIRHAQFVRHNKKVICHNCLRIENQKKKEECQKAILFIIQY